MTTDPKIAQADRCLELGAWRAALPAYAGLIGSDPVAPLAVYHCSVELADVAELDGLALPPAVPPSARLGWLVDRMLVRALALCRTGDVARASRLLRGLTPSVPVIEDIYRAQIDAAPAPARPTAPPGFLAAAAGLDPARARARFAGRKVLVVAPRLFGDAAGRGHEPIDNLMLSARSFGLAHRELSPLAFGADMTAFAAALGEALSDWQPDLVIVENLFFADRILALGNEPPGGIQTAMLTLLRQARGRGTRVVAMHPDAWLLTPDQLCFGLGDAVDIVHHLHPTVLGRLPATDAQLFCYPFPYLHPPAGVAPDTVPRLVFAGSIGAHNLPRVVWWAELARRGAAVDFLESRPVGAVQRSDQEFVDLLAAHRGVLNISRRSNGVRIFTGRSIETLLAGGLLIEEDNDDVAYFLEPGTHYLGFSTLAELEALIDALERDPARRAAIRAAGHAWARRWFTGDCFWAALFEQALG